MIKSGFGVLLLSILTIAGPGCGRGLPAQVDEPNKPDSVINGSEILDRSTKAARSVVIVQLLDRNNATTSYCTATLIGRNTILTGAHCFDTRSIPAFYNFNVLFSNSFTGQGALEVRKGLNYSKHPRFNSEVDSRFPAGTLLFDHDIAVAVFQGPGPTQFSPVDIDSDIKADYSSQKVYTYGYGRSVDYTGAAGEDLNFSNGKLRRGIMYIEDDFSNKSDRYFIKPSSPSKVCQGDSGGPQFYHENGVLKIIGVNSASVGPALANGASSCTGTSQVTKVAPFASWIREQEARILRMYATDLQ